MFGKDRGGAAPTTPARDVVPRPIFAKTLFLQEISIGFSRRMDMRLAIKFRVKPFSKGWRWFGGRASKVLKEVIECTFTRIT